jgi:hypothetical protein
VSKRKFAIRSLLFVAACSAFWVTLAAVFVAFNAHPAYWMMNGLIFCFNAYQCVDIAYHAICDLRAQSRPPHQALDTEGMT